MRVREVMDSDFVSVRATDTLRDVAERMARHGRAALPVLDEAGRLAGLVTELDVLKVLLPDYLEGLDDLSFLPADLAVGPYGFSEVAELPVARAMRTEGLQTVTEDEAVVEAIRILVHDRLQQVVVLREGRVVGMVRAAALIGEIVHAQGRGRAEP